MSETQKELQLASKPAIQLIQQLPEGEKEDQEPEQRQELQLDPKDFDKPMFQLTRVSLNSNDDLSDEQNSVT